MHVDLRGEHRGRVSVLLAQKMSLQGKGSVREICVTIINSRVITEEQCNYLLLIEYMTGQRKRFDVQGR